MPESERVVFVAEPYPDGDDHVALQLGYLESSDEEQRPQQKFSRFSMNRDVAVLLSEMLNKLLAAPDIETAWKQIAESAADGDCSQAVEEFYAEREKS